MFIHSFKYALKQLFRQKEQVFWSLLFPIALASLFYFAFSGLSEEEQFDAIPVAVVLSESEEEQLLETVVEELGKEGEDQFLQVTYATEEEALSLLEKKAVTGILYDGMPVKLTISSEMTSAKLEQSILNCFVEQFNMNYDAIEKIAVTNPDKLPEALEVLSAETSYNKETAYSNGDLDEQLNYFFNLIAMTCLYSYMGGLTICTNNQGNISVLGARKCISPVHKMISLLGDLCAAFLFHFICVAVSLVYIVFVLKINFGNEAGYVILAALTGCIAGVSLGFFVGSIGKADNATKNGILMAVVMILSFLSGLMAGGMRMLVERICPQINRINSAALISDSFYSLTVYQSHERYFTNVITLIILSIVFCITGFFMVRREKYAAL